MIYDIRHHTRLTYAVPVAHARFNLRLIPWPWKGQTLWHSDLRLIPQPARREESLGPYCVNTTQVSFDKALEEFEFDSEFTVEITPAALTGDGPTMSEVNAEALSIRDLSILSPVPYLFASRIAGIDLGIGNWASQHLLADAGIIASVSALMGAIYREFTYTPGSTTSSTPPAEAFRQKLGVCQDFAHIMIMGLRSNGISAAYASGYLRTIPPPGQPRLVGADAMHAWVNVWCGSELGWVGFDPTNNSLAREDHIQIAMGRDYADVAPVDGIFIGSALQDATTFVDVEARG